MQILLNLLLLVAAQSDSTVHVSAYELRTALFVVADIQASDRCIEACYFEYTQCSEDKKSLHQLHKGLNHFKISSQGCEGGLYPSVSDQDKQAGLNDESAASIPVMNVSCSTATCSINLIREDPGFKHIKLAKTDNARQDTHEAVGNLLQFKHVHVVIMDSHDSFSDAHFPLDYSVADASLINAERAESLRLRQAMVWAIRLVFASITSALCCFIRSIFKSDTV